jgi:hypothetical protein
MQHLEGSGTLVLYIGRTVLISLNAELNQICLLLALLGAHFILHVSRIRVKGYVRRWRHQVFPKRRSSSIRLHVITIRIWYMSLATTEIKYYLSLSCHCITYCQSLYTNLILMDPCIAV